MYRLLTLAIALALLSACAGNPPVAQQDNLEEAATETVAEVEPPERAIPEDSLYPLLLAEFALRRQAYGVALENYTEQAPLLRDPAVSAHTTHLAQFMQRRQETKEAAQLWVELEPDNLEANNILASLLVNEGQAAQALPHLAVVARGGKKANFPMLLSNYEEMSSEQQAQLQTDIALLAAEMPENTQLMLTEALILAQEQKLDESMAKLEQLFELEPYQPQALLLESKLLITQGDDEPFAHIEEALEENPRDKGLRLQYARLLAAEDLQAARAQFEILSAQSPRDADLLLSLALINRETGNNLEAKAYLRQILALGQRTDEAHYYLGRIAEDNGETATALEHYRQVGNSREFLSAAQHGGQILVGSNRLAQTRDWFNAMRKKNPRRREQLYALESELFTEAGHLDAAMSVLSYGLEEYPESMTLRYARSMLGEQRNDLALMESDLRSIIALDPANATALNALGYTLANRTDRYSEAHELIARALELQPEEPAILDSMGWVLYRQGQHEEALEYLSRAYAAFPDPEVAAHLGEVLWVSGDSEGATTVWQGALERDPDHKVLVETLQRLGVTSLVGAPN